MASQSTGKGRSISTSGWSEHKKPMVVRLQATTPGTGLLTSTHDGVNGNGLGNSTNVEFFMAGKVNRPRCGVRSMATVDKLNSSLLRGD